MRPDLLWAPWRLTYLKNFNKQKKGCLFCRALRSRRDQDRYVFLRSRHAIGLLNIYPYTNGHVMIAPRRHVGAIGRLKSDELCDMMEQVKEATRRLDRILRPDGYNIGINVGRTAGAGIDRHLHVHVVPRWKGDTNFMPVCAGAKVISQSLDALYRQLCCGAKKK